MVSQKKVVVTGGQRGVGSWCIDWCQQSGFEVTEFSRSAGYDITQADIQSLIIEKAQSADIFINSAHDGYSQCQLLQKLFKLWQNQDKLIINIGAWQFSPMIWDLVETSYVPEKAALHVLTSRLQQEPRRCKISLMELGMMDVPSTSPITSPKVDKKSFQKSLDFIIHQAGSTEIPRLAISQLY